MVQFDINTAKKAARFSVLAYKKDEEFIIPKGYTLLKELIDKKEDTRGIVLREGKNIIISFRGTSSFKNAITDVEIFKEKYPSRRLFFRKYKTHRGFTQAYLAIKDELLRLLKENLEKKDKVLFTGHSLGGAISTIGALDFKRSFKFKNKMEIYTFGSPKVGNNNFTRAFNKHVKYSFRVVNDEDVVPQLPPRFEHVKTYVLIDEGIKIIINPNFAQKFEKRLEGTGGALTGKALKAHSSDGYLKFMETIDKID